MNFDEWFEREGRLMVAGKCSAETVARAAWFVAEQSNRGEIERLQVVIDEVHSWAVCACIATPEDMAQNFPRIVEITTPGYATTTEIGETH